MRKYILPVFFLALASSSFAEMLAQPTFKMEVADGWVHTLEHNRTDWPEVISLSHPERSGVLKIVSYHAPAMVSRRVLREMTNVDWSKQLAWESWGEFAGYRYSYSESGSFFRQWWLTDEQTILFFVYNATTEPGRAEADEVERMVRSVMTN